MKEYIAKFIEGTDPCCDACIMGHCGHMIPNPKLDEIREDIRIYLARIWEDKEENITGRMSINIGEIQGVEALFGIEYYDEDFEQIKVVEDLVNFIPAEEAGKI